MMHLTPTPKISEYAIASDEHHPFLVHLINDKLAEGWQPYGQLQCLTTLVDGTPIAKFMQVMVKYDQMRPAKKPKAAKNLKRPLKPVSKRKSLPDS